jgi:hypothetical protein
MKTRVTYASRVLRQTLNLKKKIIFGSSEEVQRRKGNKGEH